MPTYSVPITRKWIDVYFVDAKSPTEAGIAVGKLIAQDIEPNASHEVSFSVGSAKLVIPDVPEQAPDAHLDDVEWDAGFPPQ